LAGEKSVFDVPDQQNRGPQEEPGLEDERQVRLRSLERWLCELLIKNQQLRNLLESAKPPER
jgi:hypothetical protein